MEAIWLKKTKVHEEVQNYAVPSKTIQAKYKNVVATAFGCLNLWWTNNSFLFLFLFLFFYFFLSYTSIAFLLKKKKKCRNHLSKRCRVIKTHTHVALHNEGNRLQDHIYPVPTRLGQTIWLVVALSKTHSIQWE